MPPPAPHKPKTTTKQKLHFFLVSCTLKNEAILLIKTFSLVGFSATCLKR